MKRWGGWVALALLAGCSGGIVPPGETPPPRPAFKSQASIPVRHPTPAIPIAPTPAYTVPGATTAAAAGVVPGPPVADLPIDPAEAERALRAFRLSCPSVQRRSDGSGLTRGMDWQPACAAAAGAGGDARAFFARWFEAVQVGDGRAYATGYYEPEIRGCRERRYDCAVPIYGRPDDLIDVDLGQFSTALKGKSVRGRVSGTKLIPYYDRTAIEAGAITRTAPVLGYAVDPVELFFLQVQGSGRIRLPDGGVLRIGYASQNGRDYTGIGATMKARGLLAPGQTNMQGIVAWLRAHPAEGQALMRENKSYVFFRLLDGSPEGALGVAVTGQASVAADPKFVPLGAPVFLSLDRTDATGIWVAQDTGGAIKGANRFDTFWGAGNEATAIAGGMSARGTAFLLLPRGTMARLRNGSPARP